MLWSQPCEEKYAFLASKWKQHCCYNTINLHQNTCYSLIGPCIIHINIDMRYMPLMPLIFILRISTNRIFSRFQSWADELFVKWIMECYQYHASLNSNISHYVNMTRVCVMCDFPISLLMTVSIGSCGPYCEDGMGVLCFICILHMETALYLLGLYFCLSKCIAF